jgi:hypothetical protein
LKKNPTWKRMRCVFFLQTSNLHPNKYIYKNEKKNLICIIQNNKKIKNKKFLKKTKTWTKFKETGDFTVAEGHMHPLVIVKLHFATLPPHISHIRFPNFSLVSLADYVIVTYESLHVHYCINQLCNMYIPICFPNSKFTYMWILHVSCLTFGVGIKPTWPLHFEVKGPLKVSLDQQMLVLAWPLTWVLHIG